MLESIALKIKYLEKKIHQFRKDAVLIMAKNYKNGKIVQDTKLENI